MLEKLSVEVHHPKSPYAFSSTVQGTWYYVSTWQFSLVDKYLYDIQVKNRFRSQNYSWLDSALGICSCSCLNWKVSQRCSLTLIIMAWEPILLWMTKWPLNPNCATNPNQRNHENNKENKCNLRTAHKFSTFSVLRGSNFPITIKWLIPGSERIP